MMIPMKVKTMKITKKIQVMILKKERKNQRKRKTKFKQKYDYIKKEEKEIR